MCDGGYCDRNEGEVRVLPTGGEGNMILCFACYRAEITWRKQRNRELSPDCQFALPSWDSLKVYPKDRRAA